MSIKGFTGMGRGQMVVLVDHDPCSVATDVPKGSLIIDADGGMYRKVDDGPTVNVVAFAELKCDLAANTPPTPNHDAEAGYSIGSRRYDLTTGKEYVCRDPKPGEAVWVSFSQQSPAYTDRGDVSKPDFSVTRGLTADGDWHALDLSSIVPAEAASKLVHLRCRIRDSETTAMMQFRKVGNKKEYNAFKLVSIPGSDSHYADGWVMLDADRKIEYCLDSLLTTKTEIAVAGWMA